MNRLRVLGFLGAGAAAALTGAAPAAAALPVAGTVKAVARPCATPRVAHFTITLKHLHAGKSYLIEWTAPTRSAGSEITQIPVVATAARYHVVSLASKGATPLLLRSFKTQITVYAEQVHKKQTVDVPQFSTKATVPACTPRR